MNGESLGYGLPAEYLPELMRDPRFIPYFPPYEAELPPGVVAFTVETMQAVMPHLDTVRIGTGKIRKGDRRAALRRRGMLR